MCLSGRVISGGRVACLQRRGMLQSGLLLVFGWDRRRQDRMRGERCVQHVKWSLVKKRCTILQPRIKLIQFQQTLTCCRAQFSCSLLPSIFLLLLPTMLFPLAFSIQPVQMVQRSCWASPLIACRIAALPLLSLLMHQPVVFVLQSTTHTLWQKKRAPEREQPEQKKSDWGPSQRQSH